MSAQIDKVARYKWVKVNKPGVFMWIPKHLILVDHMYQRDSVSQTKVLEIASAFDWAAFGCISVAIREEKYYAIDGQHRLLGAIRRGDISEVPCMVFDLGGAKEEASAFLATNTLRRPIGALARHKAAVAAGDQLALQVNAAIAAAGLKIGEGKIGCIKCLSICSALSKQDHARFVDAVSLAAELYSNERASVHEKLLQALFELARRLPCGLSDKRLRDRILSAGPDALLDGIYKASAFYARGSGKVFAEGVLQVVNKGLRNPFSIDPEPHPPSAA